MTTAFFAAFPEAKGDKAGMTRRDYIATAVLQGLLAGKATQDDSKDVSLPPILAKRAVQYADALLKELESKGL